MRTELTAEEIAHYQEYGFVVLEEVLDAGELDWWRKAVFEAVERRSEAIRAETPMDRRELLKNYLSGKISEHENELLASLKDRSVEEIAEQWEYYARVFVQRVNLWQTDDVVRELVLDERIGKMAAELANIDGIRLWHDQALFKPPWGNPTAWHLDVPYWSFTSPDALSMWIALDDATPANGCLYFVPGSHKARKYDNVGIGKELGALFDVYPEWKEIEPVAAPMRAGSASFHNGLTAHGAGTNMTSRPRRAMTLQFMPEGATFNGTQNILPAEVVAKLNIGDALDDDSVNPLLWSRTSQGARV